MKLLVYIIFISVTQSYQHFYVMCETDKKGYFILLPSEFRKNENIRMPGDTFKRHPVKSILRKLNIGRDNMRKYFHKLSDRDNSFKIFLRDEIENTVGNTSITDTQDEMEVLVENELLNALSKKASAILDRPYVQKKGRNDFLVIHPELNDPFVTIVPNDMYYNAEKKCVNWLDDCNRKGIRERLLQKVNSPY